MGGWGRCGVPILASFSHLSFFPRFCSFRNNSATTSNYGGAISNENALTNYLNISNSVFDGNTSPSSTPPNLEVSNFYYNPESGTNDPLPFTCVTSCAVTNPPNQCDCIPPSGDYQLAIKTRRTEITVRGGRYLTTSFTVRSLMIKYRCSKYRNLNVRHRYPCLGDEPQQNRGRKGCHLHGDGTQRLHAHSLHRDAPVRPRPSFRSVLVWVIWTTTA